MSSRLFADYLLSEYNQYVLISSPMVLCPPPSAWLPAGNDYQNETRKGAEIHGPWVIKSLGQDWDADSSPCCFDRDHSFSFRKKHLSSPCKFAITHLTAPFIDLSMGLFRGAVFRHGGGARKQPIKQPTEMPTSTMALMGRFLSLMGRFPTLMGRFPISSQAAVSPLENPLENSPLRKGAFRGSWSIWIFVSL